MLRFSSPAVFPSWCPQLSSGGGTGGSGSVGGASPGFGSIAALFDHPCYPGDPTPLCTDYDWLCWTLPVAGTIAVEATAPRPPRQPPSVSWTGAFLGDLFSVESLNTSWNSFISSNGCINLFFQETAKNFITPGLSSTGPGLGSAYGAQRAIQAINYAASTPSRTFGTKFLIYPMKPSVFRNLLSKARRGTTIVVTLQFDPSLFNPPIPAAIT